MSKQEFISKSAEETKKFAKEFAEKLKAGAILALYGDLGTGKTTFIQGLAAGLGYTSKVFSPTFIFVRPYKISNRRSGIGNHKKDIKILYHIDLYRLRKAEDLKNIGLEEFLNEKGAVSAIEWPEKIEKALPANTIKIKLETIGEEKRKITSFE